MTHIQGMISVAAPRQGLHEITSEIEQWLGDQSVRDGLLTAFISHTSASILIQENIDHDVQRDLEDFFARIVPENAPFYRHTAEGSDDMPAHIKGALTQTHLAIPVGGGSMRLGRYQGIFLFEHRRRPRPRTLILHLAGD
jgi:secondary thiamine-phosphate synthase enzyme